MASPPDRGVALYPGGIILDAPSQVPALWGRGHDVLWAEGEPLVIAGPPGVGKTTIAQQLTLARCGFGMQTALGFPVKLSSYKTLYVAADRPRQALRSMRRMVGPEDRDRLDFALLIARGPFNALIEPGQLIEDLIEAEVGTVVFDSIKDVAGDVSDGTIGAELNRTMQALVAAEIEVVALHHPRKAQQGNMKPKKLDDLYGSQWIAAGAGSVLYVWGEPGDREVEMLHLKQPDDVVGPLTVIHDHTTGTSSVVVTRSEVVEKREEVRLACIEALRAEQPQGRDGLKTAIRSLGVQCGNELLNEHLDAIATDDASGVRRTSKGFVVEGCPE